MDVKAAFLEGKINIPMFMEWPPGSVELGYVTEQNRRKQCIRLMGNIYGNVDAALRFYWLYAAYLIKLGFIRSKTDPCLFILKGEDGELNMLALCHVDDTQIAGTEEQLDAFKEGLRKRFKIKDLGEM